MSIRLAAEGEQGVPLLVIAVRNAGYLKGVRGVRTLVSWSIAERSLGRPLGEPEGGHLSAAVREYTAWWRQSERTTWRDLQAFRAAFPTEESPSSLAAQLRERAKPDADATAVGELLAAV